MKKPIRQTRLKAILVAAGVGLMVPALQAADVYWTGAEDLDYLRAVNWGDGLTLPQAEDNVIITNATGSVTFDAAGEEGKFVILALGDPAWTTGGSLTLVSGQLTGTDFYLYGTAGAPAVYTQTGGALSVKGVGSPEISKTDALAKSNCAISLSGKEGEPAIFNLSGGTVDVTAGVMMWAGVYGKGIVNQTGGDFTLSGHTVFGRWEGDEGWLNLTGGTFTLTTENRTLLFGEMGTGHLLLGGTGRCVTPRIHLGRETSDGSTIVLQEEGYLKTGAIATTGKNPSFTFNGGTLATYAENTTYAPFISPAIATVVKGGGATFEISAGSRAEIPGVLATDGLSFGGLVKKGAGTLVLKGANTYTGATDVQEGLLVVDGPEAVAESSGVHVAAGAGFGTSIGRLASVTEALGEKLVFDEGAAIVLDTSDGNASVGADDLPATQVIEKTGANVLTITTALPGVTEIRVRAGIVKAATADAIPETTKVVLLGGSYAPYGTSYTGGGQVVTSTDYPLGLAAVGEPLAVNFYGEHGGINLGIGSFSRDLILNDTGADYAIRLENPLYFSGEAGTASIRVGAQTATIPYEIDAQSMELSKTGAGSLVAPAGLKAETFHHREGDLVLGGSVSMGGRFFNTYGGTTASTGDDFVLATTDIHTPWSGNGASFTFNGGEINANEFSIGRDGGSGTFNHLDGTMRLGTWFLLGRGGTGTYNLKRGTVENTYGKPDDRSYIGGWNKDAANGVSTLNMSGDDTQLLLHSNFQVGFYKTGVFNQSGGLAEVDYWMSIGRFANSKGTMNVTGGTFRQKDASKSLLVGEQGEGTLNVSGSGRVEVAGMLEGTRGSGSSVITVGEGGTLLAKGFVLEGVDRPYSFSVNGGTIGPSGTGTTYDNFFDRIKSVYVGAKGMTFDTGDNTVQLNVPISGVAGPGTITKVGSGTLALPSGSASTGGLVVKEGTVVATGGTPVPTSAGVKSKTVPHLLHRWSFNDGDKTDAVGGSTISTYGTVGFENNELVLPGGSKGTGWADLGGEMVPGRGPFTIELFATLTRADGWTQIFSFGRTDSTTTCFHMGWTRGTDINKDRVEFLCSANGNVKFTQDEALQPYTYGTKWHIAATFQPLADGRLRMFFLKESLDGATKRYFTKVSSGPFSFEEMARTCFWLGHSPWNDPDAGAKYDEVRVWDFALPLEQLTYNAKMGPDSLPTFEPLVHRWSFNGDYEDSVGGLTAEVVGAAAFNADNTAVELPGGANGTGHLDLGADVVPMSGEPVTLELWATQRETRNWARIFDYGNGEAGYLFMGWTQGGTLNTDRVEVKSGGVVQIRADNTVAPYELGVPYHLSLKVLKNADGTSTVSWARRNAETGAVEKSGQSTTANPWTFADIKGSHFYLGHSQYGGDYDAAATYDEVRIWRGLLTDEQLTANAKAGPDAVPAKPAFDVVSSGNLFSPLVVEAGATFSTGSSDIEADCVQGAGKIEGEGRLLVDTLDIAGEEIGALETKAPLAVKNWVLDAGSDGVCDQLTGEGTLDVSGLTLTVRNPRKLSGSYVLADVANVTGVETATLGGDLKGWTLSANGGRLVLDSAGFLIILR